MPENYSQRELRLRFFDLITAQENAAELNDITELHTGASLGEKEAVLQRRAVRSVVRLARLKEAYKAGRPEAVLAAISYCSLFEYVPPSWVVQATNEILLKKITPNYRRRVRGYRLHLRRWQLIRYFQEHSIEDAVALASKSSRGTATAGSEPTFWNSHRIVQRALRRGMDSRFHNFGSI